MLELIQKVGMFIYIYCTDFVINLANLTGSSYYQINAFIFILVWPILTVGFFFAYLLQKIRLTMALKKKIATDRMRERVIACSALIVTVLSSQQILAPFFPAAVKCVEVYPTFRAFQLANMRVLPERPFGIDLWGLAERADSDAFLVKVVLNMAVLQNRK